MYDPILGRWLEQDPIGFNAGDMNLYRVEGNNPVNNIDPSGLDAAKGIPIGQLKSIINDIIKTLKEIEDNFIPRPGKITLRPPDDPRTMVTYKKLEQLFNQLLKLIENIKLTPEQIKQVNSLIEKLGDNDYNVRESAKKQLIGLGCAGYKLILEATKNKDLEIKSRAKEILEIYQQQIAIVLGLLIVLSDPNMIATLDLLAKNQRLLPDQYLWILEFRGILAYILIPFASLDYGKSK